MTFEQTSIEIPAEQESSEKKAKKADTAQLNVRIDAEIVDFAKAEAERLGESQAEFVTNLVKDYQASRIADIHPNFASDKDSFDSHLRQVTDLYTSVISKYNTLREDIEKEVQEEMDRRKSEIDRLKAEVKEFKVRAEKAEAEAETAEVLRKTIEAKDATIKDKDAIIAANANLSVRLDAELAKAEMAERSERQMQERLAEVEMELGIAKSKIASLTERAEKAESDARDRIEDAKYEVRELKAEHELAIDKVEEAAEERLAKAEEAADKRIADIKAETAARIAEVKDEAAERVMKLEADIEAKDLQIASLYEKIAAVSIRPEN